VTFDTVQTNYENDDSGVLECDALAVGRVGSDVSNERFAFRLPGF